jgi:hypothetical protein
MMDGDNACLIRSSGILNVVCRCFIEGIWVVALAPAVRTIRGAMFQPCEWMRFMNGWYLFVFKVIALWENLSLQELNSINWMNRVGLGWISHGLSYESPKHIEDQVWVRYYSGICEVHRSMIEAKEEQCYLEVCH